MNVFEDNEGNFLMNALFDRKPVKFHRGRSDMITAFQGGSNRTDK